jgi:hypothetical protein
MRIIILFIIIITFIYIINLNYELFSSNKKVFITFGAGSQKYYDAVDRLTTQVKNLNLFDTVIGYTDTDLKNDTSFWNKHSEFILNNRKGYGYWIWKSYLIMKTLDTMNENDILVYNDCGCEINPSKKDKMIEIFNIVDTDLIVGSFTGLSEKPWNKMDVLLYLDMNDEKYLSNQRQGGVLCIKKCQKTYNLFKEWYEICCNYNLIDDSPSVAKNYDEFVEHRHDQSIFSLLTKKYNIYSKTSIAIAIDINRI